MVQKDGEMKIVLPKIYKYFSVFLSMKCNLKCSYCLNEFDGNFNRKRFKEISGEEVIDGFKEKFPERFFNIGICEQTMIGIASGMALKGLKPYVYTITPFLVERPFEQINLDINQQDVNVKLIGYADYPNQGPTHSEIDDKWIMERFENIKSYFPKNSEETRGALIESYEHKKPTFISLKKDKK